MADLSAREPAEEEGIHGHVGEEGDGAGRRERRLPAPAAPTRIGQHDTAVAAETFAAAAPSGRPQSQSLGRVSRRTSFNGK